MTNASATVGVIPQARRSRRPGNGTGNAHNRNGNNNFQGSQHHEHSHNNSHINSHNHSHSNIVGSSVAPHVAGGNDLLQKNKTINRSLSVAAESGKPSVLLDVIEQHLSAMNGINLATAFHRLAKMAPHSERELIAFKKHPTFIRLWNTVVEHVQNHSHRQATHFAHSSAGEMPIQCLSIVAWSCATLQHRHRQIFSTIADLTAPRLLELKPYELSNLIWAFAKASMNHSELFKLVGERLLCRQDGEFKVQCLSTVAWSFATLKRRNLALFGSLARELCKNVHLMKPQELSNTLWAFAKCNYAHAELFQVLGSTIREALRTTDFKPQEISNTAWAFATVGVAHPELFRCIEEVSLRQQANMAPQNVANLLWAFAKLKVNPSDRFVNTLLDAMLKRLPQYKTAELSAACWAMSELAPDNAGFFQIMGRICSDRSQEFSCNGIANLVHALAGVTILEPQHFVNLVQASVQRQPNMAPRALITLLHGLILATQNPSLALQYATLRSDALNLSLYIATRLGEFQGSEVKELSKLLREQQDPEIFQVLASELPKFERRRQQSVEELSTSAEEGVDSHESQDEDYDIRPSMKKSYSGDEKPMPSYLSAAPELISLANNLGSPAPWSALPFSLSMGYPMDQAIIEGPPGLTPPQPISLRLSDEPMKVPLPSLSPNLLPTTLDVC